jgi:hypothetical protein
MQKKSTSEFLNQFNKRENLIFDKVILNKIFEFNNYNFLFKKFDTCDFSSKVKNKILEFNPDKVFALDILAVSFVNKLMLPTKKLYAWLGDLNFTTIYYHYYYNLKSNFKKILLYPLVFILIYKWKLYYKSNLVKFKILSGSNTNLKDLKKINIDSRYLPYPWPIKYPNKKLKKFSKPSFIFFGNLKGLGSRSAIDYLLNKIYPAYEELWGLGNFTLYICGNFSLEKKLFIKLKKLKAIQYLGFQKNIQEIALRCHACLFPIDVPVGNRSRIVTSLASYWPVIAHKNVSLGNPALKSGLNCFLANNIKEFKNFSLKIFENDDLSKKIAMNGFKTYNKTFEPSFALKLFKKFINE